MTDQDLRARILDVLWEHPEIYGDIEHYGCGCYAPEVEEFVKRGVWADTQTAYREHVAGLILEAAMPEVES